LAELDDALGVEGGVAETMAQGEREVLVAEDLHEARWTAGGTCSATWAVKRSAR